MPLKTIDYSKSVIYKIVCNDLNITDVYVGHTTDFIRRKSSHKSACINEKDKRYNLKVYQMIRNNGGWDNWSMVEIEKCNFKDSNEAGARERHYYETLNSTMNKNQPNRSIKELYEDNKDKRIIYQTQYNKDNKEKYNIYQKQYQKKYRLMKKEKSLNSIDNSITCDNITIC